MYNLEEFDNRTGYKIPWDELEKMLDTLYPDSTYRNGWYRGWKCNNWVRKMRMKNIMHDRSYLQFRRYKISEIKNRKVGWRNPIFRSLYYYRQTSQSDDVVKKYQESENNYDFV